MFMAKTPNHSYNTPEEGESDWHTPLNDNFEALELDVEIRDEDSEKDTYDPEEGAKFLATDTGVVYEGDGDEWVETLALAKYDTDEDDTILVFEMPDTDSVKIEGNIEVEGTKHFVQAVSTSRGPREVVYTATEAPTPRTQTSGTARLEDGRAEIDLPEHFAWVTSDEEALMVQTTPYSVDSNGLAVVERSLERLVVEDLDSEGVYEFAYTVTGTREGHEQTTVVRQPGPYVQTTGDESAPGDANVQNTDGVQSDDD